MCKNYGPTYLNALMQPITRRHPGELLVGDYLTLPTGKGGYCGLGLYLDTCAQHLWAFKHKGSSTGKTTTDSLGQIFKNFVPPETFMTDGGKHFDNQAVRDFCAKWNTKTHIVSAYAPWVNGLVEGTNKLLLHVLKRLCAPDLDDDELEHGDWTTLPRNWPDHLDDAVRALNYRILPSLGFSPKELLLGTIINTARTPVDTATSELTAREAATHIAYVAQQQLDGYEAILRHATQRKATFDKRVLKKQPNISPFERGTLVQVYRIGNSTGPGHPRRVTIYGSCGYGAGSRRDDPPDTRARIW